MEPESLLTEVELMRMRLEIEDFEKLDKQRLIAARQKDMAALSRIEWAMERPIKIINRLRLTAHNRMLVSSSQ